MSIKRLNKERRPLAKPLNQHENKFYLTMDETVSRWTEEKTNHLETKDPP